MEVGNTLIDCGSLTVYNSNCIGETYEAYNETENQANTLKCYLKLKDELFRSRNDEETANELKKLQHQYKDFDINSNEILLPKTKIEFPRFQKFERIQTKTKWEKFAKEKGIQKIKKRSKLVWSAEAKDWVPRWGHKSEKHLKDEMDIIREVKKNGNAYEDPFLVTKNERKIKSGKQKVREMQNKLRCVKKIGRFEAVRVR